MCYILYCSLYVLLGPPQKGGHSFNKFKYTSNFILICEVMTGFF